MHIEKEIKINAPIDKVWNIFIEIENWKDWAGCVKSAKWLSEDKWNIGSRFNQVIKNSGISGDFKSTVIIQAVEEQHYVRWSGIRKLVRGIHSFKFETKGNITKVVNYEIFEGILAPFVFILAKKKFNSDFEQFLQGLKIEAEKK